MNRLQEDRERFGEFSKVTKYTPSEKAKRIASTNSQQKDKSQTLVFDNQNNSQSYSKFDQSNTLANLLMFESGAYEINEAPKKIESNYFVEGGVIGQFSKTEQYPEYYRDNQLQNHDEEYSEQSEDNLCNFLLKLFGVLAYKIRINQRASFEKMFIEASRKIMFSQSQVNKTDSKGKRINNSYIKNRSLTQTEEIFPIKQQNQSDITKKQSAITFNNLKNGSVSSQQQQAFSQLNQPSPHETTGFPFNFNTSIKRKQTSSFSQPTTSLGRKIQIENIQYSESAVNTKNSIENQSQAIAIQEPCFKLCLKTNENKQNAKQMLNNLSANPISQSSPDLCDNQFLTEIMSRAHISSNNSMNRTPTNSQRSSQQLVKINQDLNDKNNQRQIHEVRASHNNKYPSVPFTKVLKENNHIQGIKQSYIFPPHNGRNIEHFERQISNRPNTHRPPIIHYSQDSQQFSDDNDHSSVPLQRPTTTYIVNNNLIQKNPEVHQRFKKMQEYNLGRPIIQNDHKIIFNNQCIPVSPPFKQLGRNASQPLIIQRQRPGTQHPQISIRYTSPSQMRPKSQQPTLIVRPVSFLNHNQRNIVTNEPVKFEKQSEQNIKLVRSQYFTDNNIRDHHSPSLHEMYARGSNGPQINKPQVNFSSHSTNIPFSTRPQSPSLPQQSFLLPNRHQSPPTVIKYGQSESSFKTSPTKHRHGIQLSTFDNHKNLSKKADAAIDKLFRNQYFQQNNPSSFISQKPTTPIYNATELNGQIKQQYYDCQLRSRQKSRKKLQVFSSKDQIKVVEKSSKGNKRKK